MKFSVNDKARVLEPNGEIRKGDIVTITDATERVTVEIYQAERKDGEWGFFTKDMLEEVEVRP